MPLNLPNVNNEAAERRLANSLDTERRILISVAIRDATPHNRLNKNLAQKTINQKIN